MFDLASVTNCLKTTVTIDGNIGKYAPTYLNQSVLTDAFPKTAVYADYLQNVINGSISKMLFEVVNKKKITTLIKSVIADFKLFDGRADFENKNANTGRFCFIEFKAKNNEDIVLMLKRISIQIDTASPNFKWYLYCDDTPNAAVKVLNVPYTLNKGVQWTDTLTNTDASLNLPPLNDDDTTYYLGYYESDLPPAAQSIKKAMDFTNGPCLSGCPGQETNARYYRIRVQYVDIKIGYIDAQNLVGDLSLPDMDNAVYVDKNNFGMNIDANVTCDISNFICSNKQIFTEPLALQSAIDLLQVIIHSERDNIDLQKAQQGALFILNGNADNNFQGLYKQYDKMIAALDVDTSGFNKSCLPCSKLPGITKRYV